MYRMDQAHLEGFVDFLPEPPHSDIDDIAVAVEVHVPHARGDQRPRQHLSLMLGEEQQQIEFLVRETDACAGSFDTTLRYVDLQVADREHFLLLLRLPATQDDADTGEQLSE